MKLEKRVLKAKKSCSNCGKETELLRFRCPYCRGEMFNMIPDHELIEAMQAHQKISQQHVDKGSRFFKQGELGEASKEFIKAIEANPWNATAHGNNGVVFLRQGKPKKALKWFERALEIDPNVPGAREMVEEARRQLS